MKRKHSNANKKTTITKENKNNTQIQLQKKIMRLQSVLLQVHVVLPQPGSNNAHRVDDKNKNKNIKVELVDKAQIIEDVPFAKEIFQVIILQTYEDLYFFRLLGPHGI